MARRSIALHLLGALLVAVAAEAGARAVMSTTTPATRWYDETAALKIDQMDVRGPVDTVFVGTSSAAQAFLPSVYEDTVGRSAYNAGLAGGTPEVAHRWIVEEVVPRLQPQTVVWGLTSLDLAPEYGEVQRQAYDRAPETRQGLLAEIDRWASRHSELVRERSVLRSPSAVRGPAANEREETARQAARFLGPDGERLDYRTDVSGERVAVMQARLRDFVPHDDDLALIGSTVEQLGALGVDVVLVELPVPARFVATHPNGAEDHDLVGAALSSLAVDHGIRFLDLSGGSADDDFVDFTHLTADAAARLTLLATNVIQSGRTDTVDGVEPSIEPTSDDDCETVTIIDEYGDPIDICIADDPVDVPSDEIVAPPTSTVPSTEPPADLHRALVDRFALTPCGGPSIAGASAETAPKVDRVAVDAVIAAINRAHADCPDWNDHWATAVDHLAALAGIDAIAGLRESTVLAAVALDELAARWEIPGASSTSSFWAHPNEISTTVELRRLAALGEPVQAAAFGSSQVIRAIDQVRIHEEWSDRFLNVGLASADAEEWEVVLDRVTADMDLEVAVWATSTDRLINDTGRQACGTIAPKITNSAENRERLFPEHEQSDLELLLGPDPGGWPYVGTSLARSQLVFDGPGDRRVADGTSFAGVPDTARNGRYVDPEVCAARVDALERNLQRLLDDGVTVVVVQLPIHPAFLELAPQAHRDGADALVALSERLDVTLVNFENLADDETEDGTHVNAAGRARVTEGLLAALPPPP